MMNTAFNLSPERRPTLVVGLGLTGWSVVRHLVKRGVDVVVTDSRPEPPFLDRLQSEFPDVDFVPDMSGKDMEGYEEIIASPGVKVVGDHVVGDIELFARAASAPVIAVTGSNGKSTVTSLVGEMLSANGLDVAVGGNIGTPALDLLRDPEPEVYVLELSSFQLETTFSLSPRSAVVLNISEDHMDRYADLAAYRDAKLRVFDRARTAVINRNDTALADLDPPGRLLSFGFDTPGPDEFGLAVQNGKQMFCLGRRGLAPVDAMALQGSQNAANVLAAMALVYGAGYPLSEAMITSAMNFAGLPHRCELVGEWSGVKWVNDSKGTNVGATLAAIAGMERPLVLIAGGQGKGADFAPLGKALDDTIRSVLLYGEDAALIQEVVPASVPVSIVDTLDRAIEVAGELAQPGDTVLFSPACASFDMFKSFEDRGDRFRTMVKRRMTEEVVK